jgi:hypothetical protein
MSREVVLMKCSRLRFGRIAKMEISIKKDGREKSELKECFSK